MRWPALRFERFFERHMRSKAIVQLGRERDLMIAAITANTNMDAPANKEARSERLQQIDLSYKQGVEVLHSGIKSESQSFDAFKDDPLFRHANVMAESVSRPVHEAEGAGAALLR